jgi:acyl-coenzyme A thioesterase PaaI-like protein
LLRSERLQGFGTQTQVWQIDMCNEAGQPTCVSRITMAVLAPQ